MVGIQCKIGNRVAAAIKSTNKGGLISNILILCRPTNWNPSINGRTVNICCQLEIAINHLAVDCVGSILFASVYNIIPDFVQISCTGNQIRICFCSFTFQFTKAAIFVNVCNVGTTSNICQRRRRHHTDDQA